MEEYTVARFRMIKVAGIMAEFLGNILNVLAPMFQILFHYRIST